MTNADQLNGLDLNADSSQNTLSSFAEIPGESVSEQCPAEAHLSSGNRPEENVEETPSAALTNEVSTAAVSAEVVIPFELQDKTLTWPIAYVCNNEYDYTCDCFLRCFSSAKEVGEFLEDGLATEVPGADSERKAYWDQTIQPMLDAAYAKFDDAFFADNELLAFRVYTFSSSFEPSEYSLTKKESQLVLGYRLCSSGPVLPDGTMKIETGFGQYTVLLAVKRADLKGVEKYSVVHREE